MFAFGLSPQPVHASELTRDDLQLLAGSIAIAHHLDKDAFLGTIERESQWNINARGDYVDGVPYSFGLCQFHRPVRDWNMTIAEADSPYYCLERMAKEWEKGEKHRKKWTGYRTYMAGVQSP